MKFRV